MSGAGGGRYVALYDGDCGFCTRWRDRMIPRDRDRRVEWVSVHDPSVASRFPGLDIEDALRRMYVYAPDGTLHKGAEGWRVLLRVLRGLSWVAALYRIPGVPSIAGRVYGFIADRRYRLSCSGAACRVPGAGSRGADRGASGVSRSPHLFVALLAGAALVGGALLQGCSVSEPPDPLAERLAAIADPRAATVLAEMFRAYGGYPAWSSRRTVEYHYRLQLYGGHDTPQVTSVQIHRLGLGPGERAYIEDLEGPVLQVVFLDGDSLRVTRGGVPVTDPDDLAFPRALVGAARRAFIVPWNLLDGGSRLEYRGERTPPTAGRVPSGPCDVVRLTVQAEGQEKAPEDWSEFCVSRVSHTIERVHDYRAEDGSYRVALWSDHRTFDGLRVATRRETRAADASGALGPLEAVAEYSEVRFDAPFGDDTFRGPAPLAASAGPE